MLFALGGLGCNSPTVGGETHWLRVCQVDAECGDAARCLCGICTKPCDDASACDAAGELNACAPADSAGTRAFCAAAETGLCLPSCSTDEDCVVHGLEFVCQEGHCATRTPPACPTDCGMWCGGEPVPAGCPDPMCECPPSRGLSHGLR